MQPTLGVIQAERVTVYHALLFTVCMLANIFGGTVSTLMSVYLPVAVRELVGTLGDDRFNFVSAYVNSVFIFGWSLGGVTWGVLSDRLGRKTSIALSVTFYGIFTVLTGVTDSWQWVMICRFLSGFGVGGVLVTTPTILSEVWPERTRSIFIGILSIGFPIGIFSAGLIDLFVSNWHQAFWVGAIPVALGVLCFVLVKESGSWTSRNAAAKLSTILDKEHRNDLLLGAMTFGTMLIGLWAIFSWLPSWVQELVKDSDGQRERGLSMMLVGAGGLTGGFFSGWLSNALGHRKAMILCFAGCAILSFMLFKISATFSGVVYAEIVFLALFFGASQGVLSAYIPELFPPSIRATATGFCFNLGRLVTATIVFFVGVLVSALGGYGNAIFIFSLVFVLGLFTTVFSRDVSRKLN